MIDPNISIDIETTGLNAWDDRVVTIAVVGNKGDTIEVWDEPDPRGEVDVLRAFDEWLIAQPLKGTMIGWNLTEFDLPFLACRLALNGEQTPFITPIPVYDGFFATGKYGRYLYRGSWYGYGFRDIAYEYQQYAKEQGIRWGLKEVAKAKKVGGMGFDVDFGRDVTIGQRPCEHDTDFGGKQHEYDLVTRKFKITDLDTEERKLYCVADAQMAMALFLEQEKGPKGQAVLLDGGLTIL